MTQAERAEYFLDNSKMKALKYLAYYGRMTRKDMVSAYGRPHYNSGSDIHGAVEALIRIDLVVKDENGFYDVTPAGRLRSTQKNPYRPRRKKRIA